MLKAYGPIKKVFPQFPSVQSATKTNRHMTSGLTHQPKIALVLGGGGARGLAHMLALEVFDELDIKPDVIVGTSIGAIFGAGFASGLSASQIKAHTQETLRSRTDLVRQLFSSTTEPLQRALNIFQLRSALLKPRALLDVLLPTRVANTFEDLVIPTKIVATDYFSQEEVVLSEGDLKTAVAASMALPALFEPVKLGDHALMDGGLVNPLPFDVAAGQYDIIVAIDVSGTTHREPDAKTPSAIDALVAASQIFQTALVREKLRLQQPDILISPDVGSFHVLDFLKIDDVLKASAPIKVELRDKLERVLSAETLPNIDPA